MADATHFVQAPTRAPRRGGIRSVAEFRSADRLGLGGIMEFIATPCSIVVGSVELCYPSPADPQFEKLREGVVTTQGPAVFGLYYGVECWLDGADYPTEALAGLELSEDRGIEAALAAYIGTAGIQGTGTDFTSLIAQAENIADQVYGGRPTITMNRGDAVRAHAERALNGDREGNLWTPNGSPVLASSAFPAGEVDAVGAITVYHGEAVVNSTTDHIYNKEYAIAENVYGLIVDCNRRIRFIIDTP